MNNIISFITSPTFSLSLLIVKILFIFFSLTFLIFIISILWRTTWLKRLLLWDLSEILTYRPYGVKKIEKAWAKIMARLETGLESEAKLAVIEADSMLDETLNRMGYAGETLGDRLKLLTAATIPNIEQLGEAHQIRNNIVHDPDYRLSLDEARNVLAIYEKTFRDLQAF